MIFFFFSLSTPLLSSFFFFFNDTATTEIYTLSLHDALPIYPLRRATGAIPGRACAGAPRLACGTAKATLPPRSEEHTSELQSQSNLVCRLLLEKKKKNKQRLNTLTNKQMYRDTLPPPDCITI